ncbi:olfactory receptor 5K1-like [Tachyglossus aculeatus]|uniref:olfactory receptor 5K1-like n=1 Tax=Tachyglossus aculeatus TaxID=9261 RepID=UPI0018F62659|nr:olfactory receptor 5K1-like [Tachyglossus aculeatus]XP_038622199.1 olfactory receptor 5K1-like [Tachyglossus aculeatus]
MAEGNHTLKMDFVLTGFTDKPGLQLFLFVVLLVIYTITIMGNLGLVTLIWLEPRLHTPMYYFLGNLGLTDACCSCSIMPKVLMNIATGNKVISFSECKHKKQGSNKCPEENYEEENIFQVTCRDRNYAVSMFRQNSAWSGAQL